MAPSSNPRAPANSVLGEDLFDGTPYRALTRLASGGMGEVYLVTHRQLGRNLAAKVLHAHLASDPRVVDRARVEAQSLARLHHANVVAVSGFGTTKDQRPFIVMEYLRGRTLDEELKAVGALPLLEAVQFTIELLSALAAAHALGIVHRDIKPRNLFLCNPHDGKRVLKVLDFGIARILPDASEEAPARLAVPTDSGVLVGTPKYLSPEGALGRRVDARADLYAAALMLYGMLTGRGPFDELERDTAFLKAHAYREPPVPSSRSSQPIPPELDAIVLRALRKDPDGRFQSADEFKLALERFKAIQLCPPALKATAVLGALSTHDESRVAEDAKASAMRLVQVASADALRGSNEAQEKERFPYGLAIALFLICGLVMAAVVAILENAS